MLMAISSIQQRPRGTNLDAVAALRTIQPVTISSDYSIRAAIARFDRLFAHPFVTDARATFTENATLRIVGDHRRKIFFRLRVLGLGKSFLEVAPIKRQLLELAFATTIAH